MSQNLVFCFDLEAIENIEPWFDPSWNKPGTPQDLAGPQFVINPSHPHNGQSVECRRFLNWYGLTLGHYWISTPLGEVLRYSDEAGQRWNLQSPYVDYQVARLFLDLQENIPLSLEAVPPDLAAVVSDPEWYAGSEAWSTIDEEKADDGEYRRDLWYDALEWWHQREFDSSYLTAGPLFQIWRVEEDVFLRWRSSAEDESVWCLPEGQIKMSVADFTSSCYSFFNGFIAAMRERIETIQKDGWHFAECHLDIPKILQEQRTMEALVIGLKDRQPMTDWGLVRSRVDLLRSHLE